MQQHLWSNVKARYYLPDECVDDFTWPLHLHGYFVQVHDLCNGIAYSCFDKLFYILIFCADLVELDMLQKKNNKKVRINLYWLHNYVDKSLTSITFDR